MEVKDWALEAAEEISQFEWDVSKAEDIREIIERHCPFKKNIAYTEAREPPLLQCSDCHNTESCAGAMARQWNHGRCMHCGGFFKVVRA